MKPHKISFVNAVTLISFGLWGYIDVDYSPTALAWYAPGAAVSSLVQSIACNHMKIFPCSALLDGEYGLNDLCIGVPVILGRNGIEKVIELDLDSADLNHLTESAEGVSKTNSLLDL